MSLAHSNRLQINKHKSTSIASNTKGPVFVFSKIHHVWRRERHLMILLYVPAPILADATRAQGFVMYYSDQVFSHTSQPKKKPPFKIRHKSKVKFSAFSIVESCRIYRDGHRDAAPRRSHLRLCKDRPESRLQIRSRSLFSSWFLSSHLSFIDISHHSLRPFRTPSLSLWWHFTSTYLFLIFAY